MRNVITQTVVLRAAREQLFASYLDPVAHAAITGGAVTISPQAGSEFQAFGGVLTGVMLAVIDPRLIVQSWRSSQFRPEDADSTLILSFSQTPSGGQIDLIHLDVPVHDFAGVTEGWEKYYWTPWRQHLERFGC
jgi:activator of HSP90 ATPase